MKLRIVQNAIDYLRNKTVYILPPPLDYEHDQYSLVDSLNSFEIFYEVKRKKAFLENNLKKIDTLFLGSSHVAFGINPKYISKKSCNFGTNSQDIYTSYHLFKFYEDKIPNLKNIILGYDVFSKGWFLGKANAKQTYSSFKYLYDIDYTNEYLDDYIPRYDYFSKVKCWCKKECCGYLYPKFENQQDVQSRAKGHMREWSRQPNQLSWLEKFQNDIKSSKKDLNFYILILPIKEDLKKNLPDYDTLFKNDLEKFSAKILNFYNDTDFNNEDFMDYDHLNEQGAKKLSLKLKNLIK